MVLMLLLAFANATPEVGTTDAGASVGTLLINAPRSAVYATLADVAHWPRVFSDIERVQRVDAEDGRQVFRVLSKKMGHFHAIQTGNEVDHLVHFHVLDAGPGGVLIVDFTLEAVDEHTTRVKESMEAVLPVPLGVLIPDALERKVREESIALYLADLAAALQKSRRP